MSEIIPIRSSDLESEIILMKFVNCWTSEKVNTIKREKIIDGSLKDLIWRLNGYSIMQS